MINFYNKISKLIAINIGVRKSCLHSPTLFNIQTVEITTKWQIQNLTGIKVSKKLHLSTLIFADDQVVTADTEDNLQKAAHKLIRLTTEHGLTILSVQKTKPVAYKTE
jgi:hypothetical protein